MKNLDFGEIIKEHWTVRSSLMLFTVSLFAFVLEILRMLGVLSPSKNNTSIIVIVISLGLAFLFGFIVILNMKKMSRIFKEGTVVKVEVCGVSGVLGRSKKVEYKFELDGTEHRDAVGIRNTLDFDNYYYGGKEFDAYVLKDKQGRVLTALDIFKKLSYN